MARLADRKGFKVYGDENGGPPYFFDSTVRPKGLTFIGHVTKGPFDSIGALDKALDKETTYLKARARRKANEETLRSLGLVKVKGALGGTYWE